MQKHSVLVILALLTVPTDAVFGDMYAWGMGSSGALGVDSKKQQNHPVQVTGMIGKRAKSVDAGSISTSAVTTDGKVFMWGQGISEDGVLDPEASSASPIEVKNIGVHAVAFTAGRCHYAVLAKDGNVYTWGCNDRGALGRGKMCSDCHSNTPQVVSSLKGLNLRQLASGEDHSAALTDNGYVYVWGSGLRGEIGNGLVKDQQTPQLLEELSRKVRICQICAGEDHLAAVDTEGHLWTWGGNYYGQLGHGLNEAYITKPRMVSRFQYPDKAAIVGCGAGYTSLITVSNKVFLWGAGGEPLPTEKKFFSDPAMLPRAVTAGQNHVIVVLRDHRVFSWGSNGRGQLGISDESFFTTMPQLLEDLEGKFINVVAAGRNHTIALAGKPTVASCPFFQDWYGSPGSLNDEFEATCHKDDVTCADGSCCKLGESCAQFSDLRWGCCPGPNMRIADDQTTCCPKDSTFNSADKTCERPVSYQEAARVLAAFEDGSLKKLPQVPAEVVAHPEGISYEGKPLTILDPTHSVSTNSISDPIYQASGMSAAADAVLDTYHRVTVDRAKTLEQVKSAEPGSTVGSASSTETPAFGAPPPSATTTTESADDAEEDADAEPITSPEDAAIEDRLREEITAASSGTEPKDDLAKMNRAQIVQEIIAMEKKANKNTQDDITELKLALLGDDILRAEASKLRAQTPPPSSHRGDSIGDDGVSVAMPNNAALKKEEAQAGIRALKAFEKERPTYHHSQPAVTDPTQSIAWIANTKLSERIAGVKHHDMENMLLPSDAPPRVHPDIIPGASHLYRSGVLVQSDSKAESGRPGCGPCPKSAGNLDCNRDCAEADAQAIDQLRADGFPSDPRPRLKRIEEFLSATASPSPSPSMSWASRTVVQKQRTLIQEGDLTVSVDSVSVHVPPAGFYRDPETNMTYKILGDRVSLAFPGSRFVSMGQTAGSSHRGHCGVSRPTCPDNSCCEEGETCCQQQDGSYGCCPFETGSCCTDKRHCCPEPYSCDLREQACVFNGTTIGLARYAKVDQGLCAVGEMACKDGSCCEDGQSCCQMYDGLQGCAPFKDAVCCSDGMHACPDGSTCGAHGTNACVDTLTGVQTPASKLHYTAVPPGASKVCYPDEITCDGGSCCNGDNTCCMSADGYEECCPYTDGVCCAGGSCCPNGYSCDGDNGQCVGPEGPAEMKVTLPGRSPYLVAEACEVSEITCPGTNPSLCCARGEGCCSGKPDGATEMVHGCCPFGEDAVCCDDGGCCPARHTCDGSMCISPNGTAISSVEIQAARQSDISPSTTSCADSRELQDKIDAALKDSAENAIHHPTNGTENMVTNVGGVEKGEWGSEDANSVLLSSPGELDTGIHVPSSTHHPLSDMVAEREKEEIDNLMDYLKVLLVQLMQTKMQDFCTVQGAVSFEPCTWDDSASSRDVQAIRRAVAEAAEVDQDQVIVSPIRDSHIIDFVVDPIPDTPDACSSIQDKMSTSMINGFLRSTLTSQGFGCADHLVDVKLPAVSHEQPLNITAKLLVVNNLQKLFVSMMNHVAEGEAAEIASDVNALKHLLEALVSLRGELGTAIRRDLGGLDLVLTEKNTISVLEQLITLLISFLKTRDVDLDAITLPKQHTSASPCQRGGSNEPPGPECGKTQMSLTSMPLRDLDDENYDPLLQREHPFSSRAAADSDESTLPTLPAVDHVSVSGDNGDFWMPEGCEGGNCKQ
jgi:alpha-tubulin suppressor-like RCC1 family protein